MASLGMNPFLNPSTRKSRPFFAAGVFTSGLPWSLTSSPPAEFTASLKFTVRPSYFSNCPA